MRKTCLNEVYELARNDDRILFIGSDLGFGTLQQFKEEMPDRFFMEGICEANVVGMAAGPCNGGEDSLCEYHCKFYQSPLFRADCGGSLSSQCECQADW